MHQVPSFQRGAYIPRDWYGGSEFFHFWILLITTVISLIRVLAAGGATRVTRKGELLLFIFLLNSAILVAIMGATRPLAFYLLFELSILPILAIVAGWGLQPERFNASFAIFFYTVITAGPLMVLIYIHDYLTLESGLLFNPTTYIRSGTIKGLRWIIVWIGFLVKVPLYGFHSWLPLAHLEAPLSGSILLAGIILKVGGVGSVRFYGLIDRWEVRALAISVSVVGYFIVGITCCISTDVKLVVAYSSIRHMGFCVTLFSVQNNLSTFRGIIIILTHALSSAGIFYIVSLVTESANSRNILFVKGELKVFPQFTTFYLLTIVARIGGPPGGALINEVLTFSLSFAWLQNLITFFMWGFILTRVFHLILYSYRQKGIPSLEITESSYLISPYAIIIIMGLLFFSFSSIFMVDVLA